MTKKKIVPVNITPVAITTAADDYRAAKVASQQAFQALQDAQNAYSIALTNEAIAQQALLESTGAVDAPVPMPPTPDVTPTS